VGVHIVELSSLGWLGAISGATAFAFAAVLALAAIVAGLAAALAFAIVFAFTSMLVGGLVLAYEQNAGGGGLDGVLAVRGRLSRGHGAADETGESGAEQKCIE